MRSKILLAYAILFALGAPAAAQSWSAEAGFLGSASRRAAAFAGDVGTASTNMSGMEFQLRRGWFAIGGRGMTARFRSDEHPIAAGQVSSGDVALRVGPDILRGEVGVGRRALSGALGRRDWNFGRLGIRSAYPIGGTGLTAEGALGWYPTVRGSGDFTDGGGGDAETRLTYQLPQLPLYLGVGYRIDRLTVETATDRRPEEVSSLFLAAGFRLATASRGSDTDEDGIFDRLDACPATPTGVGVDAAGCRLDRDADGVYDEADSCPTTPFAVMVDDRGCRVDSDGDGVYDDDDACPSTAAGVAVTVAGCRVDTDGDGVPEELDRCPGTVVGAEVDGAGCRLDTDGDGVFDEDDRCSGTDTGVAVDRTGCPILFEEDSEAILLEGVNFESGSAQLTSNAQTVLDLVAQALVGAPEVRVQVVGHTDSSGNRASNVQLSQDRAESVVRFLVEHGVDPTRMEALGLGPDEPIADNGTPDGREVNRRVELRRIGG